MGLLQRLTVVRRLAAQAQITEIIVFDQTDRANPKIYYVYPNGEKAYVKTGAYPTLGFNIRVKNAGDTAERLWCRITGDDGYTMTLTTSDVVQPGYTMTFGPAGPMPEKWAYQIIIETGVYGGSTQDTKTITVYNPDVTPPPEFPWWILGLLAGGVVLVVVGKQQGWIK